MTQQHQKYIQFTENSFLCFHFFELHGGATNDIRVKTERIETDIFRLKSSMLLEMKHECEQDLNRVKRALKMDLICHAAVNKTLHDLVVASLDVVHLHYASQEELDHQRRGIERVPLVDLHLDFAVLQLDPGMNLGDAVLNGVVAAVQNIVVVEEVGEGAESGCKGYSCTLLYGANEFLRNRMTNKVIKHF